jgi:DNA polymerase-1
MNLADPDNGFGAENSQKIAGGFPISGAWSERLGQVHQDDEAAGSSNGRPVTVIPRSVAHYAGRVTFIDSEDGAAALVDLAKQRSVSCIGIDFEYRYSRPGVHIRRDHCWNDPLSLVPQLLAITLVDRPRDSDPRIIRFVVDCRCTKAVAALRDLFKLPLPFVAHFAQAELLCLWALGLPAPDQIWDTCIAERAFQLGLTHARNKQPVLDRDEDVSEEARRAEEAERERDFSCSLLMTCLRHGVQHPFAGAKQRLQQSFLTHPDGQPFSVEQIDYASADSVAAVELYVAQVRTAANLGCLAHLINVEMPWTVTNARIIWDGVRVCPERSLMVRNACQRHRDRLTEELSAMGLHNANSHPQLREFFRSAGLLEAFRTGNKYSFDDKQLEAAEDRHPAVALIRHTRKAVRLLADKALTGELVGADGRLHPDHRQLGAESGRNSMRDPNIGGIGRVLRPVVVPDPGYGIGEVDLSQIEVGIAAAVYGDPDLVRMFNAGDVYTVMAKRYFAHSIGPGELALPDKVFKKKHHDLRDRMKRFTLATIYNITAHGLAVQLGCSTRQAAEEQAKFMDMFPTLSKALKEASYYGVIRGYAYLCSGLRRWRARLGNPTGWETNWMRNTPVQGSAGVVFKVAGNRLYRRYQFDDAKLILPMHDAFVFEAPRSKLTAVAKLTADVMRGAVQEYFPMLDPQVEINIDHPDCWNKDGKSRSLDLWLVHPEHARRYV